MRNMNNETLVHQASAAAVQDLQDRIKALEKENAGLNWLLKQVGARFTFMRNGMPTTTENAFRDMTDQQWQDFKKLMEEDDK